MDAAQPRRHAGQQALTWHQRDNIRRRLNQKDCTFRLLSRMAAGSSERLISAYALPRWRNLGFPTPVVFVGSGEELQPRRSGCGCYGTLLSGDPGTGPRDLGRTEQPAGGIGVSRPLKFPRLRFF